MSKFRKLALGGALLAFAAGAALAQQAAPARPAPLGRVALPEEIAAWDIAIRPDGKNLPPGKGSVKQGEKLYGEQCAICHGEFGEGAGNFPVLVGGEGSLTGPAPTKSIGSYWPYASTSFDYIRRAMPFGNAQSLTPDETYAIVAFLLNQNNLVGDDFVLSKESFASVQLPNRDGFYEDDRETAEKHFWREPCMKDCAKEPAKVTSRARSLDVTPDSKDGPKVE
ncbi:MAG: cytochrome c [Rhizobiales bacterium]|nr:cytochrome c [Hyphomicrobiales bacterium]